MSGSQVYVSGTTSNGNLTAGGTASIAAPSSGGTDAFVFNLTDNGTSATANHVSYVGTSGSDQGGAVTVGTDGTVYLTGTTTGTFAGQPRNVAECHQRLCHRAQCRRQRAMDPAIWRRLRPVHRRRRGGRSQRLQRAGRAGPAAAAPSI